MGRLKQAARRIPLVGSVYMALRSRYVRLKFKPNVSEPVSADNVTEQIFTEIYRENGWSGKNSLSGAGSDDEQTKKIIEEVPGLFREFRISSILDIPCGDFYWMKKVDLSGIDYIGADIVGGLIKTNQEKYGTGGVRFEKMDLIKDKLPKVDLVLCRDCLIHLPFADIVRCLSNICKSGSSYLLTTTHVRRTENHDIQTGQWHAINLEIPPFTLGQPIRVIVEGCTEFNGTLKDKALGLWKVDDIKNALAKKL